MDFVFCQWISILSMQLLLRVVMLARCMLSLCVCPSVRHTTESHRNTSLIHGHRGRSFLQRVHTRGGVGWNWRSLTNISLYLRNGTRYGNIYYRTLIGTDVSSIKWRYFQWLWVTPNYPNHSIIPFSLFYIDYHIFAIFSDFEWPLTTQTIPLFHFRYFISTIISLR